MHRPITLPRLATEVWDKIKHEDWVLTTNAFEDWALKLWDFDKPYRWPGKPLGTGTQIGMATAWRLPIAARDGSSSIARPTAI